MIKKGSVLVLLFVILALVFVNVGAQEGHTPVTVCHNDRWITVDDSAVPAHIKHGDYVWTPLTPTCGDETIPAPIDPPVNSPVDPPIDPPVDPEPEAPVSYLLYLPIVRNDCAEGATYCR